MNVTDAGDDLFLRIDLSKTRQHTIPWTHQPGTYESVIRRTM